MYCPLWYDFQTFAYTKNVGLTPENAEYRKKHTPEFRLPARCGVEFPTFSFCMEGQDDRIVANLLRNELHPGVFESFSKHGIAAG